MTLLKNKEWCGQNQTELTSKMQIILIKMLPLKCQLKQSRLQGIEYWSFTFTFLNLEVFIFHFFNIIKFSRPSFALECQITRLLAGPELLLIICQNTILQIIVCQCLNSRIFAFLTNDWVNNSSILLTSKT